MIFLFSRSQNCRKKKYGVNLEKCARQPFRKIEIESGGHQKSCWSYIIVIAIMSFFFSPKCCFLALRIRERHRFSDLAPTILLASISTDVDEIFKKSGNSEIMISRPLVYSFLQVAAPREKFDPKNHPTFKKSNWSKNGKFWKVTWMLWGAIKTPYLSLHRI